MKNIKAFGRNVDRREACEIIINDKVYEICHVGLEQGLRNIMLFGWAPLDEWSDQELEDFIERLCEENQPDAADLQPELPG